MLINCREISVDTEVQADLVIIGSGAAGLSIAEELKSSGMKIAIVESGDLSFDPLAQFNHESEGFPVRPSSRIRQFGGSTTAWSGKWLPLSTTEAEARPWMQESSWPIPLSDLRDYYERASRMHSGPLYADYEQYQDGGSGAQGAVNGLHLVSVFWLPVMALDFANSIGKQIRHSKNIDLYYNLTATNIALSEDLATVERIDCSSISGRSITLTAKSFVLACGGIENARLMLASNRQVSAGVGNDSDTLGRYFMDHPRGSAAVVEIERDADFPQCLGFTPKNASSHRLDYGLSLSASTMHEHATLNPYLVWRPKVQVEPSESLRNLFADLVVLKSNPWFLKVYKRIFIDLLKLRKRNIFAYVISLVRDRLQLSANSPKKFALNFHLEQGPNPENRITLSDKKDRYGQPVARITRSISVLEMKSVELLHDKLAQTLESTGVGTLTWNQGSKPDFHSLPLSDASHHMGSTRMGIDSLTSVVDPHCRVHGVSNLYIAGSSVFPASGFSNPTYTIVALAIRLADHLRREIH